MLFKKLLLILGVLGAVSQQGHQTIVETELKAQQTAQEQQRMEGNTYNSFSAKENIHMITSS